MTFFQVVGFEYKIIVQKQNKISNYHSIKQQIPILSWITFWWESSCFVAWGLPYLSPEVCMYLLRYTSILPLIKLTQKRCDLVHGNLNMQRTTYHLIMNSCFCLCLVFLTLMRGTCYLVYDNYIMLTTDYYFKRVGFSMCPFGPTQNIYINMETSVLLIKSCKFWPILNTTPPPLQPLRQPPSLNLHAVPAEQFQELDH